MFIQYNQAVLQVRLYFAAIVLCLSASSPNSQAVDAELQRAVAQAMASQHGSAVVLDVQSARVLAEYHIDVAARRVVHPGSSIKPFTLLALLEAGKVDAQTALVCKRPLTIAGRRLDCSHPDTKEPLGPSAAIAYSCNSYFTSLATRLMPAELRASFMRAGFTSVTDLAPHEATGEIALAQSPEQLQLQAIGEWGIRITPLELLRAYRQLALLSRKDSNAQIPALLAEGLQASVSYGMARAAQPDLPMKVAGKTGTALSDEGPWRHGWFAGYAPADNPQIVLVVFMENAHGSDAAALASRIFAAFANERDNQSAKVIAGPQR